MMGDYIVKFFNAFQAVKKDFFLFRVGAVKQGCFSGAFYQISVITGAIGQGNQGIKKMPVEMVDAQGVNAFSYFNRFYKYLLITSG